MTTDISDIAVTQAHPMSAIWAEAWHAWEKRGHWAACEVLLDHFGEPDSRVLDSEQARATSARVAGLREAASQGRAALQAMMDAWFGYHDAHSLTQPVTGAAGNAFDKALEARDEIDAALATPPPDASNADDVAGR